MQHFLIPSDLTQSELQISDKALLHQMQNVLRFKIGQKIIVMDGQGGKAPGEVKELHRKGAVIALEDLERLEAPKRELRLYCALSKKPSTFELIVQKATEIGATQIVPLVTERVQVPHVRKPERLHAIIKESCEQCERAYLPELAEAMSLNDLLANPPSGRLLAGDPWTYDVRLAELEPEGDVNLLIGPEGGLTEEELAAIKDAGGTLFLLGDNILRMETAAIAALSLLQFGKV